MDDTTLNYTPDLSGIALAANNHDLVASGGMISGAWNFASKAVPMAGISALNGLVNIPVDLVNIPYKLATGNELDRIELDKNLYRSLDQTIGTDLQQYYQDHKSGIDMAGFMVSSLVPGTLGVKVVRAGIGAAARVESSSNMGRALGLIGRLDTVGERTLDIAKAEMAKGSPFSYLSSEAFKLYGAGAANGVVDALAFNTAATLALHRSPYLDNKDFGDLAKDVITDSVLFGAPFGAVVDTFGKGVGYFGVRNAIKPYEKQLTGLARFADDINPSGIGEVAGSGSTFKEVVETIRKKGGVLSSVSKEVETTIPVGDVVAQYRARLDDLAEQLVTADGKQVLNAFEQGALDAKGLLSKNPFLRQAEIDLVVSARQASVRRLELNMEQEIRKLFDGVADSVDVGSFVKQVKEGDFLKSMELFPGLRQVAKFTEESLSVAKEDKVKGFVVMDLERNTIVSKPAAVSVFDLAAKDSENILANQVKSPVLFNSGSIQSGRLDSLTGSAAYKEAIQEFSKLTEARGSKVTAESIVADMSKTSGFNFEKDFAKLDVLTSKIDNKDLLIKVNGKLTPVGEIESQLLERKVDLISTGVMKGKSPEELSAILHMPEEAVMRPYELPRIKDLTTQPKARFILANYDTKIRSVSSQDSFMQAGALDFAKRNKLAKDYRDLVVAEVSKDLMSELFPKLPMDKFTGSGGAGILKFADAEHGNLFQQTRALLAKGYDTLMRKAAGERESVIGTYINNLVAGGRTSLPMVEASAFNAWQKQARQLGGGVVVFMDETGNWNAAYKELFDSAQSLVKAEKLKFNSLGEMLSQIHGKELSEGIKTEAKMIRIRTPELVELLSSHNAVEKAALKRANMVRRAKGDNPIEVLEGDGSLFQFYDPPPNKSKEPFVLVIKGSEDHQNPLYRGQTYVHTFKDEKSLIELRAKLPADLQSYTKKETEEFFKGVDQYNTALAFNGSGIKNALKSKGILVDSLPGEQSVDKWLETLKEWHVRDELAIQRNAIALKHAEEFASLRAISYEREATRGSRFNVGGKIADLLSKSKTTDAESVINELLNVQSQGPVNAVVKTLDQLGNRFFGKVIDTFRGTTAPELTTKEAADLVSHYEALGIEQSYSNAIYSAMQTKPGVSSAFDRSVRFTNMALATGQLRLDPLNLIVNVIGSPILGSGVVGLAVKDIRNRLTQEGNEAALKKLDEVFGVADSGFGKDSINFVATAHKSIGRRSNLVKDSPVFGSQAMDANETLPQFFQRIGITTNAAGAMMDQMQNDMISMVRAGNLQESKATGFFKKAWDKILKPSDLVESEMQWISADAGLQIAEAAGMKPAESLALINTIVQKLQGNFTAAQKPQVFQGTVGAAVGLFQSYQARLIHRVLDVVDSGDKRMLAEMAAMQAGIFGAKSLPGFDLINTHLIAENNKDKQDIYSGMYGLGDRSVVNGLLYGAGSSVLGLNLSTRGAVDFRAPTGITTVPAVDIWIRGIGNTLDLVKNAAKGADLSVEFNHAVQHTVMNRPIQQLASWTAGYRTSLDGKIAIDSNDPKFQHPDAWLPHGVTQAMRMLGGAPLDEAVYMDTVYRWNKYRLQDAEKTKNLGHILHSQLLDLPKGQTLDESVVKDFKEKYVSSGGTLEGFHRWYKNQLNNSTTDAGERLRKLVKNSEEARQLQIMLGGTVKEDKAVEKNQ